MSDDGYVEIVKKERLWAAVPESERVTLSDIDRWKPSGRYADWYRERLAERVGSDGQCEIAVRSMDFGSGKWLPCAGPTDGHSRCKRHGGPGKQQVTNKSGRLTRKAQVEALQQENVALRMQVMEARDMFQRGDFDADDRQRERLRRFMEGTA